MNEKQAIRRMVSPGMRRNLARKFLGGIIQIHITRSCDKSCFGCTQGSNLGGRSGMIPLEQFEKAVISLRDYFGIVGVFGGNPALHPKFPELCDILVKHIPFERRGLWCNHPKGHGKHMRETFNPAVSNLNVHLDKEAYDEFKRDWPESQPFGLDSDSRHSPVYVAMKDVISDESERLELISKCDVNRTWSAMIGMFRGEIRGWFCEIAGAQSILHQWDPEYPDTGVPVVRGWWKKTMGDFVGQVRKHCHECGVPLRGYGSLAASENGVEQVSESHVEVYQLKRPERLLQVVKERSEVSEQSLNSFVSYIQNAEK